MGDLALVAASEEALYVVRSSDSGKTWQTPEVAIADLDAAAVHGAPDGSVYVGTRGKGLLRSRDGLRSWEPVETPAALQKVRALAIDGERFLAGNEARPDPVGVFEWEDGKQWRPLGDLAACSAASDWRYPVAEVGVHVRHLSRDPHQPERLYAAIQVGGVAISTDGGASWQDRTNLDLDVHMIQGHPTRPGVVYAGTGGGGLYRSEDYGESWECISEGLCKIVVQFGVDPSNGDRLYLGTAHGGPRSWQEDPTSVRAEMSRSDDGGDTWQQLSGGLPEPLRTRVGALHIQREEPANVFFSGDLPRGGPDSGVYHSGDSGETWQLVAPLPKVVALWCAQA